MDHRLQACLQLSGYVGGCCCPLDRPPSRLAGTDACAVVWHGGSGDFTGLGRAAPDTVERASAAGIGADAANRAEVRCGGPGRAEPGLGACGRGAGAAP